MATIKFGKDCDKTLDFLTSLYPCLFYVEIEDVPMHFKSLEAYTAYVHGLGEPKANKELLVKIYNAYDPFKVKYFQTKKAGFVPSKNWEKKVKKGAKRTVQEETTLIGLRLKFSQNGLLAAGLLHTGDAKLKYIAPWDELMGTGKDGKGKNRLGKLLMKVREELKTNKLMTTLPIEDYSTIVEHGL